ncbi:hypothetical protein HK16_12130 [Acetobacter senegalensis]|uniref:Uncharacterized protein n=1 Tax=Acetobacter senegalensis TaxID=446692 RepID=A0A252EI34_9PROT|nr:hypothetical protein HK16_12130 [Acetobacter senegalensis]
MIPPSAARLWTVSENLKTCSATKATESIFAPWPFFVTQATLHLQSGCRTDLALYAQNVIGRYVFLQAGMDF